MDQWRVYLWETVARERTIYFEDFMYHSAFCGVLYSKEDYKMCVGKSGAYGGNTELMASVKFVMSFTVYFVFEVYAT